MALMLCSTSLPDASRRLSQALYSGASGYVSTISSMLLRSSTDGAQPPGQTAPLAYFAFYRECFIILLSGTPCNQWSQVS